MSRYKVFIAYKGSAYCTTVARFVDQCIWQNQMIPHIALKGANGQISYTDENDILRDINNCDAFVAVNAKGPNRYKFKTECDWAFDAQKPMVAVIQEGSRPIPILKRKSGQYVLRFKKWRPAECSELVDGIKMIVKASRPARYVPEGQALQRRKL